MDRLEEIALIRAQEQGLILAAFDESVAFAIGASIHARALAENLGLIVDIRTWDRPLFYAATSGTSGDNQHWARRKIYIVQRVNKSSLRAMLENNGERQYPADRGHDPSAYALHGGAFPIKVAGIGTIGAIAVSGLKERDDHAVAVDALCDHLGIDRSRFAIPKS